MMRRSKLQNQDRFGSTLEPRLALGECTRLRVRTRTLLLTCP